jgi:hypothetical protein
MNNILSILLLFYALLVLVMSNKQSIKFCLAWLTPPTCRQREGCYWNWGGYECYPLWYIPSSSGGSSSGGPSTGGPEGPSSGGSSPADPSSGGSNPGDSRPDVPNSENSTSEVLRRKLNSPNDHRGDDIIIKPTEPSNLNSKLSPIQPIITTLKPTNNPLGRPKKINLIISLKKSRNKLN